MSLSRTLRRWIRRGQVLTSPAQLTGYNTDGLGYKRFRPDAVVIPADADELCDLLAASDQLAMPIVIRGAGTSLSGGPVAAQGGIVVHLSALRTIGTICPEGLWCEVQTGVTLHQLDQALAPYGLFYPPDPSSGSVCTIGGNVAMNAGGAHCFRYGVTGNYVLGVEAVLLDGTVRRWGGPGGGRGRYQEDWKRLMVGSEGTLATFTRFWLRLLPRPQKVWTFQAIFDDLQLAQDAIHGLVGHSAFPVAIELMDPRCVALVESSSLAVGLPPDRFVLITEIDGPQPLVDARVESVADLLRQRGAQAVQYSDDPERRERLWKARKVAGGLMGQTSPDLVVQDAVIPKRALAQTLELIYREADAAGVPVVNMFHAGDGNLHPNFLFDSRVPEQRQRIEAISHTLMRWIIDVGGTLSGEHGIGNDKIQYMPLVFSEQAMRLQRAAEAAFSPDHQLNPLKVFQHRRFHPPASNPSPTTENRPAGETSDSDRAGEVCETDGIGERGGHQPASGAVAERLFQHHLEPLDAVACVPADATADQLQPHWAAAGLRLPLLTTAEATLWQHVLASSHSPASSRFGSWSDNIIGMNWQLPDGQRVRIGEQVVKSTTGYDVLRFLLESGHRYGRPTDLVVRLRPLAHAPQDAAPAAPMATTAPAAAMAATAPAADQPPPPADYLILTLTADPSVDPADLSADPPVDPSAADPSVGGDGAARRGQGLAPAQPQSRLLQAAVALRHSDWTHWLDSLDYVVDGSGVNHPQAVARSLPAVARSLRVVIHLPPQEAQLATAAIARAAAAANLQWCSRATSTAPSQPLPDVALKTHPAQATQWADQIAGDFGLLCQASVTVGSIGVFFDPACRPAEAVQLATRLLDRYRAPLAEIGGDGRSRWLDAAMPPPAEETVWLTRFQEAMNQR